MCQDTCPALHTCRSGLPKVASESSTGTFRVLVFPFAQKRKSRAGGANCLTLVVPNISRLEFGLPQPPDLELHDLNSGSTRGSSDPDEGGHNGQLWFSGGLHVVKFCQVHFVSSKLSKKFWHWIHQRWVGISDQIVEPASFSATFPAKRKQGGKKL